jgi:HEXXH motif-containing protein
MSQVLSHLLEAALPAREVRLGLLFRGLTNATIEEAEASPSSVCLGCMAPFRCTDLVRVVKLASPFVWLNVQRVYDAMGTRGQPLEAAASVLRAMAFDSLFDALPDQFCVSITNSRSSPIILPTLGIVLDGDDLKVTRLSSSTIEIDSGNSTRQVNRGECRPCLTAPIPGEVPARLLLVRDPSLFEQTYYDDVLPPGEVDPGFSKDISLALRLIGSSYPELLTRLRQTIRWYVPIRSPDEKTHCSFSSPQLPGVIFLSQTCDVVRLAEAIVHELGHNELDMFLSVSPLFDLCHDSRYYSPWRDDARPIQGLFHAVYVFGEVARLECAIARTQPNLRPVLRERAKILVHRLRLGLAQLPLSRILEDGLSLLRETHETVEDTVREFEVEPQLPFTITSHLELWRLRYPELARDVVFEQAVETGASPQSMRDRRA